MAKRNTFGEKLRAIRDEKDLTLQQLADAAGLNLHSISKIESGQRPNPTWETILALAEALGVTPDAFLDDQDEKPPKRRKK